MSFDKIESHYKSADQRFAFRRMGTPSDLRSA
jgi:hypothetical protein